MDVKCIRDTPDDPALKGHFYPQAYGMDSVWDASFSVDNCARLWISRHLLFYPQIVQALEAMLYPT